MCLVCWVCVRNLIDAVSRNNSDRAFKHERGSRDYILLHRRRWSLSRYSRNGTNQDNLYFSYEWPQMARSAWSKLWVILAGHFNQSTRRNMLLRGIWAQFAISENRSPKGEPVAVGGDWACGCWCLLACSRLVSLIVRNMEISLDATNRLHVHSILAFSAIGQQSLVTLRFCTLRRLDSLFRLDPDASLNQASFLVCFYEEKDQVVPLRKWS